MKLLFGTGNKNKYLLMKKRLEELKDIELIIPGMIDLKLDIVEDGNTPEENAIIKAKAFYEATNMATIAEDSGLYVEEFDDDEQPGLFVKRVNGIEGLSEEEILSSYLERINNHGGLVHASYHTGVCLIDSDGNVVSTTINETSFEMTNEVNFKEDGDVLDSISFDIEANKYFNERTDEDKKKHYLSLDKEYKALVKKYILR